VKVSQLKLRSEKFDDDDDDDDDDNNNNNNNNNNNKENRGVGFYLRSTESKFFRYVPQSNFC
jgi:hypothetical protein